MNSCNNKKAVLRKRLLALASEQSRLQRALRRLPPVPLRVPFRSGWIHFFQLAERSKRRRDRETLETILAEINTGGFFRGREVAAHLRKKGKRRMLFAGRQTLKRVREWRWGQLRWPEDWKKRYFNRLQHPLERMRQYEFAKPDVFEVGAKPHLVTHVQGHCPEWEAWLHEIDSILRPLGGWRRIAHATGHSTRQWNTSKPLQLLRFKHECREQMRQLRDDGVISQALCLLGFKASEITSEPLFRTSSIKVMQRAFNARNRERYPGGSPVFIYGRQAFKGDAAVLQTAERGALPRSVHHFHSRGSEMGDTS